MAENLIYWLIPIASTILSLILGYIIGNWKAKNDMLLERRTEIFEDILRSLSNLIDRTTIAEIMKEAFTKIKKTGIDILFQDEHEKIVLETAKGAVKEELQRMGVDVEDKEVASLLKKSFLSSFGALCMYLQSPLIEIQLELNENVMALKMYLDPKMRDKLKEKADEFDKYFEKFRRNEIDALKLRDKASEFAERIFEIMKF